MPLNGFLAFLFVLCQRCDITIQYDVEGDFQAAVGNFTRFVEEYAIVEDEISQIGASGVRASTANLTAAAQAMCYHVTLAKEAAERMVQFQENGTILSIDEEAAIRAKQQEFASNITELAGLMNATSQRIYQLEAELLADADDAMTAFWRNKTLEYKQRTEELRVEAERNCGGDCDNGHRCNCHKECKFFIWFCDEDCRWCSDWRCCNNGALFHNAQWSSFHNYEKLLAEAEAHVVVAINVHKYGVEAAIFGSQVKLLGLNISQLQKYERVERGAKILETILAARKQITGVLHNIQQARLILGRASAADCDVAKLTQRLVNAGSNVRLMLRVLASPMQDVRESLSLAYRSKSFLSSLLADDVAEPYRKIVSSSMPQDDHTEVQENILGIVAYKHRDNQTQLQLNTLEKLVDEVTPHGADCTWGADHLRDGKVIVSANSSFWRMCDNGTIIDGGRVGDQQHEYLITNAGSSVQEHSVVVLSGMDN